MAEADPVGNSNDEPVLPVCVSARRFLLLSATVSQVELISKKTTRCRVFTRLTASAERGLKRVQDQRHGVDGRLHLNTTH